MKWLLLIAVAMFAVGCSDDSSRLPAFLANAERPLVITYCSEGGITIVDNVGNIYIYDSYYYFTRTYVSDCPEVPHEMGGYGEVR